LGEKATGRLLERETTKTLMRKRELEGAFIQGRGKKTCCDKSWVVRPQQIEKGGTWGGHKQAANSGLKFLQVFSKPKKVISARVGKKEPSRKVRLPTLNVLGCGLNKTKFQKKKIVYTPGSPKDGQH